MLLTHFLRRTLAALAMTAAVALAAPALAQAEEAEATPDANLDALASQLKGETGTGLSSLQLSGFADFSWVDYNFTKRSGIAAQFGEHPTFFVGNLNLYLDAQLSQNMRSLIEVRFTYLPNGNPKRDATTGETIRRDFSAMDYADLYRDAKLGSIMIQRAWIEYRFDDRLALRAGQFLTPYGIWNVDHGSPAIIGVLRPFIIGQQLIPEAQVGLEAYGTWSVGPGRLGYHATVSNGRIGNNPIFQNTSGAVGLGGRVFYETNTLGDLRVGASGYTGEYEEAMYGQDPVTFLPVKQVSSRINEWAMGLDAHWAFRGLVVNAEYLSQTKKYKTGKPAHADTITQVDDDRRWGTYLLAGYSLPFHKKLMPFVMHEFYRATEELRDEGFNLDFANYPSGVLDIYKYTFGLNYHLRPNVVVKAQYGMVEHRGTKVTPFEGFGDNSSEIFVQTAWAF